MALVRMKPPVGVSVGLGADDKLYYIDGQGFANVDSGSVTKLTAEGWVSAVPVAPEAPGNTFPISATKTLTGGIEITGLGKPKWVQDITYGRAVFASNVASAWSDASSTAPGTIADTTDIDFGDGQPALKMTFASAPASIVRATRNMDGYATAGTLLNGRTITIPVYVTDPSRIRSVMLYLSSQASGFSTFAVASLDQGAAESLVPGVNYMSFHCADASAVTVWTLTAETFANPIKQMRIAISTYGKDCGPAYIGAPCISARNRPTILISMDDGWVSQLSHSALGFDGACEYLRRAGLRATLYIPANLIGTANYMSWAQLKELNDDGFDIGNHTISHNEFNTASALGVAGVGVSSMTISAPAAPGGAARVYIDVVTNIGDNAHLAVVSGTRASDGVAITEYMTIGPFHGTQNASDNVFSSVSSIAIKANDGTTAYVTLGTITAFWTMSAEAIRSAIVGGRDALIAHGLTRAADHFCYPRGMYNPEAVAVLKSIGTKTARSISSGSMCPRRGVIPNRLLMPAQGFGGASNTAAKMIAETQAAIDTGTTREMFMHNFIPGVPSASTDTKWSDFTAFVDDLATKQKAGLVDVMTKSEFYSRYTFAD